MLSVATFLTLFFRPLRSEWTRANVILHETALFIREWARPTNTPTKMNVFALASPNMVEGKRFGHKPLDPFASLLFEHAFDVRRCPSLGLEPFAILANGARRFRHVGAVHLFEHRITVKAEFVVGSLDDVDRVR